MYVLSRHCSTIAIFIHRRQITAKALSLGFQGRCFRQCYELLSIHITSILYIIGINMPGSYRTLGSIAKPQEQERVKSEEERAQVSSSQSSAQAQDVFDGKWTLQQNLKFAVFIHYYQTVFASKRKRKLCKIFKSLSEYLQKRTPTQCRSHFQKMIVKHRSIARIKKYYKAEFGNETYAKELNDFRAEWEESHKPLQMLYPELRETKEVSIQTEPLPEACGNCNSQVQNQTICPQYYPYQANPFMFWQSEGGLQQNMGNYLTWMPTSYQE